MPVLDEFQDIASETMGRTVPLSGDVCALLFTSLGAIAQLWQWTQPGGLTQADIDYIDALIAKGNRELMTTIIGTIQPYITVDPPPGTIPCDGGVYYRIDYPQLYEVLDPAFILDSDSFTTPFMNGRTLIGAGVSSSGTDFPIGSNGGEETHTQTEDELATHAHSDAGHTHTEIIAVPATSIPGELPVPLPSAVPGAGVTGIGNASITNTGLSSPMNIMQPYNVVKFCVVAT